MPNITPTQATQAGLYLAMQNQYGYTPTPPQQQMIVDAFSSQTYVPNQVDVQHEPVFDQVAWSNGGTQTTYTQGTAPYVGYPLGYVGPQNGATVTTPTSQWFTNVGSNSGKVQYAQTSMSRSQQLPAPEAFAIFGIRLRIYEAQNYVDTLNLFNGFGLQFWIGGKAYNSGPLWLYASGGGITGYTTNSSTQFLNNGVPGREGMNKLALPIVIENQAQFFAQLIGNNYTTATATAGGQGVLLELMLDGLHARGVQ